MTITSPVRTALRIPYLAVRTPLGLLDEQVVVRLCGADSVAHRSLLRGLHALDALAESAFTATDDTTDDDDATDTDAEPEAEAEIIPDVEPVERDGGEQPIEADEQAEIQQLVETFLAEDELTPRSGELADNDELRRVQAEIRAKQEIETRRGQI